jgi:glycerol-3-phosphate acyltransferase PlsY
VPAYHGTVLVEVAVVALGYALGTLPTAQLVGRRAGVDPTTSGSGNPGASNVYRTAGARAGALVFAGDLLKGALAAGIGWAAGDRVLGLACGFAAVVGHVAPVTRRFRGGKGVATAGGVLAVLFPVVALVAVPAWLVVVKLTGKASLASLAAVIGAAVVVWLRSPSAEEIAGVAAISLLVILRHTGNIRRLVRGEERSVT